jgi:hypothetical protein
MNIHQTVTYLATPLPPPAVSPAPPPPAVGYWSVLTCEESPYAHRQTGEILIYPFFSAFIWIFV